MADDTTEIKVKSPTGQISIVPIELRDVLVESGYQVASRRAAPAEEPKPGN